MIKKNRKYNRIHITCPVCADDVSRDLLKFFQHLEDYHYPSFSYQMGHFLYYHNGKLLDRKVRNSIEDTCVKLLLYQADIFLKGMKSQYVSVIEKCSNCRLSRSAFTSYVIVNKFQFLFCKSCKNKVLKTGNHVKIIYNPTELGKR